MEGKIYFVGAGPGDPGLLTVKGKDIISRADVVVYAGSLVNPAVLEGCRQEARVVNSASLSLEDITSELVAAARQGLTVARIHSGDPSIYGAIAEQMEILDKEQVAYEIIPGVSSVCAAAAALNMEYTLPGVTQTLILTRAAGRTPVPEQESIPSLARHRASMAIFLSVGMIEATVRDLLSGGYPAETPAAVVYRASWPEEHRIQGTLATIADMVRTAGIKRQALILVGAAVGRSTVGTSRLYAPDFTHGFRQGRQNENQRTAVLALTRRGWHTGKRILSVLHDADLFLPVKFQHEIQDPAIAFYSEVKQEARRLFSTYRRLVLVMATGIAVRLIAPLVSSKWEDPAVVAMDDGGRNIISLLSGHWGGANELALRLAQLLGSNPVVTTESDVMGFPSVDMLIKALTAGTIPEQASLIKDIQMAILEDEDAGFYPRELSLFPDMTGHPNIHFFDTVEDLVRSGCTAGVIATHRTLHPIQTAKRFMVVHPRDLVVGIGCHRGISVDEIARGIKAVFEEKKLFAASVRLLCSIDSRSGEAGLLEYARMHSVAVRFFSADEINSVTGISAESVPARKAMGVHGVAEPCALLGAQGGGLVLPKVRLENMTIAVAALPISELIVRTEDREGD